MEMQTRKKVPKRHSQHFVACLFWATNRIDGQNVMI